MENLIQVTPEKNEPQVVEEKSTKKKKESKVKVTKIQATSRMSVKIHDNFYTVEYLEERSLPNITSEDQLNIEKQRLFDSVNTTIDDQIREIVEGFNK